MMKELTDGSTEVKEGSMEWEMHACGAEEDHDLEWEEGVREKIHYHHIHSPQPIIEEECNSAGTALKATTSPWCLLGLL